MATKAEVTAALLRNWDSVPECESADELVALIWGDWEGVSGARPNVGGRILLAKTCNVCGHLKQADQFWQESKTGYWTTSCRSCHTGGGGWQWEYDNQEESLKTAEKRYQPYTGADWEILVRDDLTIAEKAKMLNRTVWGVKTMVKKHKRGDATPRRMTEGHPL